MLLEITVRNIALIEYVHVDFDAGFNVLTGETGAGKSILVDALSLALGGKADKDMLRTGTSRASVEALFDIRKNAAARSALAETGVEAMEDGCVLISRELTDTGRTISRINGSIVPLSQIKRLTSFLVDMHGQHEHQALLNPQKHLQFLDSYGDDAHRRLLARNCSDYTEYTVIKSEIERLSLSTAERERMRDMLSFQIDEIDAVKPKAGEDKKLEAKDRLYQNSEKLAAGVGNAYKYVYSGEGRMISAQETLQKAVAALEQISDVDERFEKMRSSLEELFYAVQDVGYELQDVRESLDYDPVEADKVSERLDKLKKLTRKYGPTLEDVIAFREKAGAQLARLDVSDERIMSLKEELKESEAKLIKTCDEITASRKRIAAAFTQNLLEELKQLGMGRSRFEVRFSKKPEYSSNGRDDVEFMLSPNPGEGLKPLSAIASGGELSRIMLAMKSISADIESVDSMIFDEIDTGVSGRMAQVVGEKMASIANKRQVICITHLPQIAALADCQFLIEKSVVDGRTGSSVTRLDREGRIQELMRLIGGAGEMDSARQHAGSMLDAAQTLRKAR